MRSSLHGYTSPSVIVRFLDIRDAIEFIVEIFEGEEFCDLAFFLDESVLLTLFDIGWVESLQDLASNVPDSNCGSISLSLTDAQEPVHQISDILDIALKCGKLMSMSDGWRDITNPGHVKLFMEFFDCRDAQLAFERLSNYMPNVTVKFCLLHQQDKEHLFYSKPVSLCTYPPTPDSLSPLSAEKKVIRRPSKHSNHSSLITASSLQLSESDTEGHRNDFHERQVKSKNDVDIAGIEAGLDPRTTCMIKNIPNKYTQQMLIDHLDLSHAGRYDFIYLRIDFKNKCNVGYAFINFIDPMDIVTFAKRMNGKRWPKFNSEKRCELAYARIQGKEALVDKFKHSRVMQEPPSYRPRVFSL